MLKKRVVGSLLGVVVASGCADASSDPDGPPVPLSYDYSGCGAPLEPTCTGLDCARDEDAALVPVFLEEVEAAGLSDVVRLTNPTQSSSNYLVEAYWFRAVEPVYVPGSEAELRERLRKDFAELADLVPDTMIDMADVPALVAACSPVLQYGLCLHHRADFTVSIVHNEGPMGVGDCYQTWSVSIDVATGETRNCVVEEMICND